MDTVYVGTQLQEWANLNEPAEELIFKRGYWDQIIFVRDDIASAIAKSFEDYAAIRLATQVISTHHSKSVKLPVFQINLPDGTVFTLRYNFYDWKVSVNSPVAVEADFMGLFNSTEEIHAVYCEGFPRDLVYGAYASNNRQFTIELKAGFHHIFTFFWIYAHKVLGKQ